MGGFGGRTEGKKCCNYNIKNKQESKQTKKQLVKASHDSLMFSFKDFEVSGLVLKSLVYLELYFCGYFKKVHFKIFICRYLVFPTASVDIYFLLYMLSTFVKDLPTVCVGFSCVSRVICVS